MSKKLFTIRKPATYRTWEDFGTVKIMNPGRLASAWGLLWNPGAWWLGVHYSPGNKRYCINLLPCLTVWVTKPGGYEP